MNEEIAKGTLDKITGAIKETVGHITGDTELEAKGKLEQAKGAAEKTVGHAKDAGEEIVGGVGKVIR